MKVSLNWIKDYVKLPEDMDLTRLAYDLTMSTVEVEGAEDLARRFDHMLVGRVVEVCPHPNADKLQICRTDIGGGDIRDIVCGGTNVRPGMKVAVAAPGAMCRWHGEGEPVEIKEAKLRGVKSYGMICGAAEIGLGDLFPTTEEAHILDLSDFDAAAGTPIADALDLHDIIDKVYEPDLNSFTIEPFPYYSPLKSQIETIKSFDRPVILVDDLVHTANRLQVLVPQLREDGIPIKKVVVGVLSGYGRDLMQCLKVPVESIYSMPNLRQWFVESTLYPFIGGDTVRREEMKVAGLQPSINMILPYATPRLSGCSREALVEFSACCIENSRDLFQVLEAEYRKMYAKNLTLSRLSEAVILPLCPDKGSCMEYDENLAASVYLENDLETLWRMKEFMIKG